MTGDPRNWPALPKPKYFQSGPAEKPYFDLENKKSLRPIPQPVGSDPVSSREGVVRLPSCLPRPGELSAKVRSQEEKMSRRIELVKQVTGDPEWKERAKWLKRARRIEKQGGYSQADIHLINWMLAGDCGCFYKTPLAKEGAPAQQQIWDCIRDREKMDLMAESPVHKYCCKILDLYDCLLYTSDAADE